jgi:multiple sugar transport system ATP-binding protein
VPPQRANRYAPYAGRDMTLGIRPEHLTESHDVEKPGVGRINAPVDVVEPMGMETMVHFLLAGAEFTARVDPNVRAVPGEILPLAVDMNNMHLIDNETNLVV